MGILDKFKKKQDKEVLAIEPEIQTIYHRILNINSRLQPFHFLQEIVQVEAAFMVKLPPEYKAFLLNYGSCFVKDNYWYKPLEKVPMASSDGLASVSYFYGKDIAENADIFEMKENLSSLLLPIADADGGDYICLGTKKEYQNKIYYWSHDTCDGVVLGENTF